MKSLTSELLADKLERAAITARDPMRVALTALATAVVSLGAGQWLLEAYIAKLARPDNAERISQLREVWELICKDFPYLQIHINALIEWIDDPGERDDEALRRCFEVLSRVDLYDTVDRNGGELLGAVYQWMLPTSVQQARGSMYTPMSVCFLLASLNCVQAGETTADPCCGAGAMAVATIREMKSRGGRAEELGFVLNDIDPIAVALAGVNMAVYNVRKVHLSCQDALGPNPWGDKEREVTIPEEQKPRRRRMVAS